MDFKNTNDSVIAFYKEFHETFSEIDTCFDTLDELGGVDFSTAKRIIELLRKYHDTVYRSTELTHDTVDAFTELEQRLHSATSLSDYSDIIKSLQRLVHEFLVYETRWPGQCTCKKIISTLLEIFDTTSSVHFQDQSDFYTAIRILRELVADCSISIRGLADLAAWSYGTLAYSQLDANDQLVVLLNQSILTDRMYYCLQSLEITLSYLNKVVNGFDELDWNVYYTVGFLNFKIHQYNDAIHYFQRVVSNNKLRESQDQNSRRRYFHANLLLAYCYEYDHDFAQAIRVLAVDPERIVTLLESKSILSLEADFGIIMEEILQQAKSSPSSLIAQYFQSYAEFEKTAPQPSPDNSMSLDMQFEILHAFAHCLNEYSIKNHTTRTSIYSHNYGKCIRFARLIMKKIASFRPEYGTCYATIHGECKDYHVALVELDNAQKTLSDRKIAKESLVAEISFFRYYFNMLCNRVSSTDKAFFENYSEKCDDDDAKCHLKIFEFRDELRRYISALYECIHELVGDTPFTDNSIIPIPDELQVKYVELCGLEPTLYMNASVRSELRLMQRAYNCIEYLRSYLIHPTAKNLLVLQNACFRFSTIKQEFHQVSPTSPNPSIVSSDLFPSSLPTVVKSVFATGDTGLLSSLYSTDSIFILAPISGVVVFQYQTGTIQELFSSVSIFPSTPQTEASMDYVDAIANSILAVYNDMSETIGLREMSNVDWNSLSKYTDIIYHWSNKVPTQVLICESGKASYVRQIVDDSAFSEVISQMKQQHDSDKSRKYCKDTVIRKKSKTLKCTLQKATLPWLEIVNEGKPRIFYIAWNDNIESFHSHDTIECFLVPSRADTAKHELHTSIRRISIIYQQVGDSLSEYESQEPHQYPTPTTLTEVSSELLSFAEKVYNDAKAKRAQIEYRRSGFLLQIKPYSANTNNANYLAIKTALDNCNSQISNLDRIIKYSERMPNELSLDKLEECNNYLLSLK